MSNLNPLSFCEGRAKGEGAGGEGVRNSIAQAVVFPTLGETQVRPSRVAPGELSPFLSVTQPVAAPRAAPASVAFPDVSQIEIKAKATVAAEPDPMATERALTEAREIGYQQGFVEGLEAGRQAGHAEGVDAGRQEAIQAELMMRQQAIEAFANALQAKADALNETLADWFAEREAAMADLAMDVVRRLVATELATSRASALAIAQEALGEITHATHARLRLNPFDVEILARHRQELLAFSPSLRNVDLVEDPSLMGGCVVETEGGKVDASLDTRLILLEEQWRPAA